MGRFRDLTTSAQPVTGQGPFVANLLIGRLHRSGLPNPPPASPPPNHVLDIELVERTSGPRRCTCPSRAQGAETDSAAVSSPVPQTNAATKPTCLPVPLKGL